MGRTISVRSEQGLGDTLQFIRYVPLLEQLGARTIVEVQPPLVSLLRSSGMENIIAHGAARPDFDAYVFMLSLPRLLRTRLDNIPADVPYLVADSALIASWRQSLAALRGFRVGIQWQGNPDYLFDALRSVPLLEFAPLAAVRDVCLINLQRKEGLDQLPAARERFAIHDLGDDVDASRGTFVDTAAVMKNLDLVVTSDTATAHLAGALGVPVWVALPSVAEWRWMSQRDDSPWYPGMRLFRQSEPNVWALCFNAWPANWCGKSNGARKPPIPKGSIPSGNALFDEDCGAAEDFERPSRDCGLETLSRRRQRLKYNVGSSITHGVDQLPSSALTTSKKNVSTCSHRIP